MNLNEYYMYRFKKAHIPPELQISDIMAQVNGMEGRFKNRFIKYAGTSETFIRSTDKAGQAIDDLRTSTGMIGEQKKGIDKMFVLAERAIREISKLEKDSGVHQVDNIPLPSDVIRTSHGKKMGYITLIMSFLTEGTLHFMEETMNLQDALESRDKIITELASQIPSMEVIGSYEDVGLNDLQNNSQVDVASYVKPEKTPISPPAVPKKAKRVAGNGVTSSTS